MSNYLSVCRLRPRSRDKGYSLVEVLIAIFITGVVATAVYSLYNNFFRQTNVQDMRVEAQQNARVAMNLMERELMNMGYMACDGDIIQEATASSIQFVYTDPETDSDLSATAGECLRVKYWLQTVGGVQSLVRRADTGGEGSWTTGPTNVIAEHVSSLAFDYFNIDGNPASTSDQTGRNNIRFVSMNLVTKTKADIQGAGAPATYMMETHIRLRNLGIGASAYDTTAPSKVSDLQVRDPGVCGRLGVKWAKNTEGDIRGYKVYYGVAPGAYYGVVNIPMTVLSGAEYSCTESGSSVECIVNPTNPPLVNSPADGSSTTTYYFNVKAYDNALNHSDPLDSDVYGDPDPSSPAFDSGADDSTLNAMSPVPVTGLSGADGPSDGQVLLTWNAYDTSANPDVTGFRIYRSESPFTSYPIDHSAAGIDWIAGEPGSGMSEVDKNATSYTDPGPGLIGCKVYYYAIAPVACDTTILTDDGGELKYAQEDYDATCGDGSEPCSPGTGFGAVSGSDTAPEKTTPPSAPSIDARAGWKRVNVSLMQPSDAALKHTCVYTEESASYPFLTDIVGASGCYEVTHPGQLVPNSDGIFTVAELEPDTGTGFWHQSMTEEYPAEPSLAESGTYSYRAVSFDNCGNSSDITGAQATTILCGEDPDGKPPAVTDASVSCCAGPVALSWTPVPSDVSSPSSTTNPYDLAGYRVIRAEDPAFTVGAQVISGSAPYWFSTFNDSTVQEGKTYYYRIATTDCPYERDNPSDATIIGHANGGYLNSVIIGPVRPGMLDRDEKTSTEQDDHREVLTGVVIDGDGVSLPGSDFTQGTVTMFLNNTSEAPMTITGASVAWVNSSAYLRGVTVGGGESAVGAVDTSLSAGLTGSSGTSPYTRVVSNASLSSVTIPGLERHVPVTFTFLDSGGSPVDMRDDQFLITLEATNDSTGSTCSSHLTVSKLHEGVSVPLGPSATATQQNKPSSPTFGYAVPGVTGANTVPSGSDGAVVVGSGVTVTVSANITGNTTDAVTGNKVPVSSATLYYKSTAKTTTTAPSSGYTAVSMSSVGGDIWSGDIPAFDGKRVWYYVLAVDADGNWDRDPEIAHGAYVYDQGEFSVCAVTPSAPAGLAATAVGSSVSLAWDEVTTYTSGAALDPDIDPILYRVFRNGVQVGSDQAETSYTDTVPTDGVYRYTVKALNSCADPEPNVSPDSNIAATCVGMSGQATISVSPATIYRGESFTVTIVDCLALSTGYETTQQTLNVDSGFSEFYALSGVPHKYSPSVTETGVATGTFVKTIETTASSEADKLQTLASDTITAYYTFASPQTATVNVVVDSCTNIPKAPASISGSKSGQSMTVNWSAVSFNTDDTAITDLAGYNVYEKVCKNGAPNCTGSNILKDWFLRTSVASGTTSVTLSADQGNANNRMYHFRVTAFDSCSTSNESSPSGVWYE